MRTTVLLLLGLAAFTSATTTYHGYKVVSVVPTTEVEVEVVKAAIDRLQLDQWTHPRTLGAAIDVLVPPSLTYIFLSSLRKHSITATIKINDLQSLIDEQAAKRTPSKSLPRAFDHTQYHTLEEINSILDGVENDYSLATSYVAGTTYEGRDVRVVELSTDHSDTKDAIWIDCGIHAREWVSPATCQYIIDQLTSGYGSDSDATNLLDKYDFHILPSVNPDGYSFTWSDDRIWRKNRAVYDGVLCRGTDCNRNFDSDFGGPGTSGSHCSDIYHGPSAFSEKESQAVRDSILYLGSRAKMYFTIHSYSQYWMTPYGYTNSLPANYNEQYRVGDIGVQALTAVYGTRYVLGNIADVIYMAAGGSSDWAYDAAGIQYTYALELRDTGNYGFLLPEDQILPTAEETYAGIVAAINAI